MYEQNFQKWNSFEGLDKGLKQELQVMNDTDKKDAFYKDLEFGTGGMRGILGAGTNRMNVYTIRRANFGFATYLRKYYKDQLDRGVVIAHDNRHNNKLFVRESARVLTQFGIKCYIFEDLRPTPELSFAVRELNAIGGIVVTASHNPPNYNGYKIYDEDGCQLVPRLADEVVEYVNQVDDVFSIAVTEYDDMLQSNMIEIIDTTLDEVYLKRVDSVLLQKELQKDIAIVFTPLHGTSSKIGYEALKRNGFNVIPVAEQMVHDPDFSTVDSPNPENKSAFDLALKYGKEYNADLLIATDPDADRLGIAVKHNDKYELLTGNQTGAIFMDYILKTRKQQNSLPRHGVVFNTIVTSDFGATIARSYDMEVISTLTGFKFIGEQAKLLEGTNREFIFGYEESYGYVIKDFVRDKDSIQALLLISEIAQVVKNEGRTLYDYLLELYDTYGAFIEDLHNIALEGAAGEQKIKEIMNAFRTSSPEGFDIAVKEDYDQSTKEEDGKITPLTLPKSNVLKFILKDGSWFVLRPSGTEPKLKVYIGVKGNNLEHAKLRNKQIKEQVISLIDKL